ncbi:MULTISPECIES: universal stress protein [Methanothermobacter]|uniref:Predicted universal stress protein n=1 Tax=Methanothermobacter marburgensis (strain ATCC BAA-927 / DSM 2133 / JCM 14651 / NBRC 100331 / OCM 82 / Marburg) TaxID=79929 RepID=D9PXL5_METTM|nr:MULTISPECIES: universal stress protein [Methanothermobacter]ADL58963.1 predicted universal stress protein [Methanothermobacter marburgensis str. Marburg]MCG2828338.1 universal stress protein [Methanothermobacter sp. K4]MDI9614376.1 universal stress protein [Methanothermobacter sp.]MDI9619083.1 universal stress protein [Methanothermobacter sp.]QEF94855.1 universal stress protein [Methanothermobacter sp. KEPCO-1]
MYSKILLPTDGSKHANKAAEHAIWIARESGAEIIALTVMETSSLVGLPADDLIIRLREMLEEEASRSLEAVKKLVEESGAGVKLTLRTDEGSPAEAILRTVEKEGVDLVVMGTSGKHGLDRFLLGSVAEKVVRSAGCPVLVVH